MNSGDYKDFCKVWAMAQELSANGKEYSVAAMTELFEMLEPYSLDVLKSALRLHRTQSKFAPTLHDVLDLLRPKLPKHLSPDEAWSIALRSFDESETVVMTQEMLEARSAAWDVWNSGDKIGARMAFRSAYERLVSNSKSVVWQVSIGWDSAKREDAVRKAVEQGLLPRRELDKISYGGTQLSVQHLVELSKTKKSDFDENSDDEILRRLTDLKDLLELNKNDSLSLEQLRADFEKLRNQEIEKVRENFDGDLDSEMNKFRLIEKL